MLENNYCVRIMHVQMHNTLKVNLKSALNTPEQRWCLKGKTKLIVLSNKVINHLFLKERN